MKEIIIGYRYQIRTRTGIVSNNYPGCKTENECWRALYNEVSKLRKEGFHVFDMKMWEEVRRAKEGQA